MPFFFVEHNQIALFPFFCVKYKPHMQSTTWSHTSSLSNFTKISLSQCQLKQMRTAHFFLMVKKKNAQLNTFFSFFLSVGTNPIFSFVDGKHHKLLFAAGWSYELHERLFYSSNMSITNFRLFQTEQHLTSSYTVRKESFGEFRLTWFEKDFSVFGLHSPILKRWGWKGYCSGVQ